MTNRQSGRTLQQMEQAPQNAIFIWPNSRLDYPRNLAKRIGRADLVIISREQISQQYFRGRRVTGVILGHAVEKLTELEIDELSRVILKKEEK